MKFVYITLAFVVVFVGGFYALHKMNEPPTCTDQKVTELLNSIVLNHMRTKAIHYMLIKDKKIDPADVGNPTYQSWSVSKDPDQSILAEVAADMFKESDVTISNIQTDHSKDSMELKAIKKCMCKARLAAPRYDIDINFTFFAQNTDKGLYVEAQGLQW